jgi:hypothetical protein
VILFSPVRHPYRSMSDSHAVCILTADWATAIGTGVTAIVAVYAAATWRRNMRNASKHKTAAKVLEQGRLFRYRFYDARNPLYMGYEFPAAYHAKAKETRTRDDEAAGWSHVFTARLIPLQEQKVVLAMLRARAGVLLGDDVAAHMETLARTCHQLESYMENKVNQYREGPEIVAMWSDQSYVEQVNNGVVVADPSAKKHEDAFSIEFEEKFKTLENSVQPML